MPTNHELRIIMRLRDEASKKITGMRNRLRRFADEVRKNWKAIAASVAVVGYALSRVISDVISYGVQLDKMSKMTGTTTREFSKLAYAAEQEHASMEALSKALPVLAKYMGQAKDGLMTYKRAFDAMGISVTDSRGQLRKTYDVFLDIAEYVSKANDKTEALQRTQEILGRGGKELYDMLLLGKSGLKQLGAEAEQLGIVLDEKTAREMKDFADEVLKAKKSFQGLSIVFVEKILPALKEYTGYLSDAVLGMRQLSIVNKIEEFERLSKTMEELKTSKMKESWKDFFNFFKNNSGVVLKYDPGELSRRITDLAIELQKAGVAIDQVKLKELITDEDLKRLEAAKEAGKDLAPGKEAYASWEIFFAGMRKGLNKAQTGYDNFRFSVEKGTLKLINSMETQFGNFFYNTFTRQVGKAREVFAEFGQSILRVLSEVLAQWTLFGFSGAGGLMGMVGIWPKKHQGGEIRRIDRAHGGLAIDEVPIIAQTGEGVLSRRGMSALGRSNFNRLNQGQSVEGGSPVIYISINAVDAKSFSDLADRNPGVFQRQILKALQYNRGYRDMARAFS